MTGQVDGPAILARDGIDPAVGADALEPVTQRLDQQTLGTDRTVVGIGTVGQAVALGRQAIGLFSGRGIDPVIGNNARAAGVRGRQDRRVARTGYRNPMGLEAVGRNQALLQQGLEAAGKVGAILVQEIGGQLVHHQGHDQGRCRTLGGARHRRGGGRDLGRRLGQNRRGRTGHESQSQGRTEKTAERHDNHQKSETWALPTPGR